MSETELLNVCNTVKRRRFITPDSWTAEIYGMGVYIRKYGFYPALFPLNIYTDHGPGEIDFPYKHEIESPTAVQFYHSHTARDIWRKNFKKPCHVLFSPFVFYRRKNNIEKLSTAKGTIAFPAHSTPAIDDGMSYEEYIRDLLTLPDKYLPVSVCLHYTDILKGRHKIFYENKIPVFTAGHPLDYRYIERFYEILINYKYATSNMAGSYTYYTVEMGIPFFILGKHPQYINKADDNISIGPYNPLDTNKTYKKLYDSFCGFSINIREEQQAIVNRGLGINEGLGRLKMSMILYYAFFKWLFSLRSIKDTIWLLKYLADFLNVKIQGKK